MIHLIIPTLLLSLLLSTPAEARIIPNAKKKVIRNAEWERLWHEGDRRTVVPGEAKKFSDLDKTKIEENFVLGYSFIRPTNWDFTVIVSPLSPYPKLDTFRTPSDSLHPGTAKFSVARLRTDKNYTPTQLMERSLAVFTQQLTAPQPKEVKVGSLRTFQGTYTTQGEAGMLVVFPHPTESFAYALLYRAENQATFEKDKAVFDYVVKTFTMLSKKTAPAPR